MVRLLCPSEVLRCYIPCAHRYSYSHVEDGFWLRTVLSPTVSRTATFPGYFQIAGTRIPVRREHGGHGPHSLGGALPGSLGFRVRFRMAAVLLGRLRSRRGAGCR